MNRAIMFFLAIGVAMPVTAETISPALTWGGKSDVAHWSEFVPPPAAFSLSITYLLFGRLPPGSTFDASTDRIGGRVLEPGSHQMWVSATDSTRATANAGITIVVT